ncbi:MAG: ABC transporter substrate-binding protein [Thermodesulfobacteriota bacterium]
MKRILNSGVVGCMLVLAFSTGAVAETKELRLAKQYGLGYLQMIIMEDLKLVEKHAKAAGLGDIKVSWSTFRSSDVMNDALISGNLDFGSLGTNGLAIIWAKTKGTPVEVKGAAGFNHLHLALITRDPKVKSITDYTEKHKIAVPAVRVSNQALLLQMAAAKQFGMANYTKLDPLTVSMTHPDAMTALLSGAGEITSHFASAPFLQRELEKPGLHQVISSLDIVGPINFNVVATTTKFYNANPKAYGAYLAALQEATDLINKDKRAAAETYIRVTKDKSSVDAILKIMTAPGNEYNVGRTPDGDMRIVDFMYRIGSIKVKAESFSDLLFPGQKGK